jgi:oxygen-independent coproporphyrinogen-3 oxidase
MKRDFYQVPQDACDVYVGIPFCPTRCSYCSFASADLKSGGRNVEAYADALLRELEAGARDMRALGMKARAIYVGGGTPTALASALLERVLDTAAECFEGAVEFTVRPEGRTASTGKKCLRSGAPARRASASIRRP